jgi:hypothetical protein
VIFYEIQVRSADRWVPDSLYDDLAIATYEAERLASQDKVEPRIIRDRDTGRAAPETEIILALKQAANDPGEASPARRKLDRIPWLRRNMNVFFAIFVTAVTVWILGRIF